MAHKELTLSRVGHRNSALKARYVVSFIINKDGSITNEKVERSVDPLLDQEALRVVRMMPKWKPGIDKNKPCRTLFAIPINFKL